jgi:hypothetical protein
MAESALRQLFGKPEQQTQESPYIDLLRQNKSKDFVNRILNPSTSPAPVQFDESNIATHQMAAEVDENGNWYVFPTIVNQGGKLVSMPLYDAFDYARKTGEYIPMPNMESAINLSENYKTKAMQDFYSRPVQRPQVQQPSNPSALRALDQSYLMGMGQGSAPVRVPKTRGQTTADVLGAASIPMSAVPIAGDITGILADAAMYAAYPEERTMGNYAMSALGVLPFVPGVSALRALRDAPSPSAVEAAPPVPAPIDVGYRGSHTTPDADYGAPLNDLTQMMPEDVYGPSGERLYGINNKAIDREVFSALRAARGKPDADVMIYRAVPKDVNAINPGDWVSTSKAYAKVHGENALGGDYRIIEQKAKAGELYMAGDPQEFGWHPKEASAAPSPLEGTLDMSKRRPD